MKRALQADDFEPVHRQILEKIGEHWRLNHYGPGCVYLANAMQITRPVIRRAVAELVDAGYIVRPKGISHAMRLADPAERNAGIVARYRKILLNRPAEDRAAAARACSDLAREGRIASHPESYDQT